VPPAPFFAFFLFCPAPFTLYRSFNEIEKRRGEQTQAMPQKKSGGTEMRHRLI
jgi:hypothetical protein